MKKIAFTFAGREKRMNKLVELMKNAINRGLIDEWHVWDLSRQESDHSWLMSLFGKNLSIITGSSSIEYINLPVELGLRQEIWVRARNDAHILLVFESGVCLEVVFGAYDNTKSILRVFNSLYEYKLNADPIGLRGSILNADNLNHVIFERRSENISIFLNEEEIFRLPMSRTFGNVNAISVHTGYGADGFWQISAPQSSIKLINCFLKGYDAFRYVYRFYATSRFADNVFVKIDDDIVYFDIERFGKFIECIQLSPNADIFSANVINNGVCAYLQSRKGYFPELDIQFEYPSDGFGGSLWESGQKCSMLHKYFVSNIGNIKRVALQDEFTTTLPYKDRLSINFVGFRQQIFPYMAAAYTSEARKIAYMPDKNAYDDEILMTQILPILFDVNKYVFNQFIASHLSFYKQEDTFNAIEIMEEYKYISQTLV
jgi:hypothetical protein